ncbi:MAG: hypothetical protein R2822_31295 [Spirosomataceae bacterium]
MKLYRTHQGIIIESKASFYLSAQKDWDVYINRDDLHTAILAEIQALTPNATLEEAIKTDLLPPIANQEVWASGVTYLKPRSPYGRIERCRWR